jgi:hypothetical protein
MTLSDLIAACESGFSSVAIDRKREGIEISSGGPDVDGDATLRTEPACLYATEGLAYSAWQTEFNRSIGCDVRAGNILIWIEKPYVETYRITLGDQHNSFRVVRDRHVVRGTVAVEQMAAVTDGVALKLAEHPVGPAVAEDLDINPESLVTIEPDEMSKPAKVPLKIKRKAKVA